MVEPHVRRELEHFFEIYKELEGRTMQTRAGAGAKKRKKSSRPAAVDIWKRRCRKPLQLLHRDAAETFLHPSQASFNLC